MSNNEDKKNQDSKSNIDEMMKNASGKVDYDSNTNEVGKPKSTKKVVLWTLAGLLIFGALLATGAIMLKGGNDFEDKTATPDWVGNEDEAPEEEDLGEWDFDHPIELDEWAMEPFERIAFWGDKDNIEAVLEKSYNTQGFNEAVMWLPSSIPHGLDDPEGVLDDAFTNDTEEEFLEDDSDNPIFSYAVREDYEKAYVTYTERLLNPIFGDWMFAQRAESPLKDNQDYNVLSDMFTDKWWEDNIKEGQDYTSLPIIVDWEGDDWGGLDLEDKKDGRYGTFFGRVFEDENNKVESEVIEYDENEQVTIKISSPVKYYAFGNDKTMVEKKGVLELTLRSNSDTIDVDNRVVINEVTLSLD